MTGLTQTSLDADWEKFDFVETVTIERSGTNVTTTGKAIFMEETIAEISGEVGNTARVRTIPVRASTLPSGFRMIPKDVIVRRDGLATEERYIVLDAKLRTLETRFTCTCVQEVAEGD